MLLRAQLENNEFQIEIKEYRDLWNICILKKGEIKSEKYQIMKSDYQSIGHIISFLFKNKSYVTYIENKTPYYVNIQNSFEQIALYNEEMFLRQSLKEGSSSSYDCALVANMPGKIIEILVKPNDRVIAGQPVLMMESMKMENEMRSPKDTSIESIKVKKGESVEAGAVLVTFND